MSCPSLFSRAQRDPPQEFTLSPSMSLHDLGWRAEYAAGHDQPIDPLLRPARVMQQGRGAWHAHDGATEVLVRARTRSLATTPVTGDWILISGDDPGDCRVEHVLPRRTAVVRAEAGGRSEQQVLAANVDLVALCASADAVNVRRLERELTAVWESGASPIVVVTKADLVPDIDRILDEAAGVCLGVDVVAVSSILGDGLVSLASRLDRGTTLALIGPSGVGKSSLVNALAGGEVLATAAVRSDGKGRHTTTSRHLVVLPGGGLLLDTPGMREFAPWAGQDALAGTFADIEELAAGCRFSDCRHESEPGCSVLIAASVDEAVWTRLLSWRALQRELAWLERRHDARLLSEERRRWAAITKSVRHQPRP